MSLHADSLLVLPDGSMKTIRDVKRGDTLLSLTPGHENKVLLVDQVARGTRHFVHVHGKPLFTDEQVCMGHSHKKTCFNVDEAVFRRHWKECASFDAIKPLCLVNGELCPLDQFTVDAVNDATEVTFGLVTSLGYAFIEPVHLVINTELIDDHHPLLIVILYEMLKSINFAIVPDDPQNKWTKEQSQTFFNACFVNAIATLAEWPESGVNLSVMAKSHLNHFFELVQWEDKALRLADQWWHRQWPMLEATEYALLMFS